MCIILHRVCVCFFFCCFILQNGLAQQCDSIVPSFIANLTNDPNGEYVSPAVQRDGFCCGATGNVKCIEFVVTLHPDAEGVIFDIYSGAVPPGALFYQINCGGPQIVGQPICLTGPGPHIITFCKPGNNINQYRILSVSQPVIPDSISVNDGCSKEIGTLGFDIPTITWTSITDSIGAYDHYLSCLSGCDTILVTPQPGYPPFIDIEVCGMAFGGCDSLINCDTVRVNFYSTLSVTINPQFPTICFGDTSISIQAVGGGGSPPYTYNWSNGDSTEFTNVNTGVYWIELGDISGCPPSYDTVEVTAFSLPIEANAGNDTVICGENLPIQLQGSVQSASGGTWIGSGTFSPSQDSLITSYQPDSLELVNGIATLLLVTTGNGTCPADTDLIQIELLEFNSTLNVISLPVSCKGFSDGIAVVNATGNRFPYTYQWDAATGNQSGDSAVNLPAGSYSVTITDSAGCILDTTAEVIEADSVLSIEIFTFQETCHEISDGSVVISINGGVPPYIVTWDTAIGTFTDSSAANLGRGVYNLSITDAFGCALDTVFEIEGPLFPLDIDISKIDIGCKNGNDGTATANTTGGTAPYSYLWSDSTGFQTTQTATGLKAGFYSVEVSDSLGCIISDTITLNEPPSPIVFSDSTTNPSCFGFNDGTATVFPNGGTPPYTYLWDSTANNQTTQTATGLSAGTYSVLIFDQNSCLLATPIVVFDPAPLFATAVEIVHVSCKGGLTGSAKVIPTGGTGPYTYQWDSLAGFQTDSIATGLGAGIYSIMVFDQNGCSFIPGIEILEPMDSLLVVTESFPVSCKDGSDGFAIANITGGTPPYSVQWDAAANSQTTDTAFNLSAGIYSVTITDSNGCIADTIVSILEPLNYLSAVVQSVPTSCFGDSDGVALITISGGTGPYSVIWDSLTGSQQNDTAVNLKSGYYSVIVSDVNNCPLDTGVLVAQPSKIISFGVQNNVNCYGENTGWAYINTSGGTAPYTFQWGANTGNQTTDTAKFLSAGTYSVTVTDFNSCSEDTTFTLTQPDTFLLISTGKIDVLCKGDSSGIAFAEASGGTSPYVFVWGPNAGSQLNDTAYNLPVGTYMVTVTDSLGCSDNFPVTIEEPLLSLNSSPFKIDLTCFNSADGKAFANTSGGTPPYTHIWTQGINVVNGDSAFGLESGLVILQISDANNCITENDTLNLSRPPIVELFTSNSDTICIGDSALINLSSSGGNGVPYGYKQVPFDTVMSSHFVKPQATRSYGYRSFDSKGCESSTKIVTIFVRDLLKDSVEVLSSGDICIGDTVIITGQHNGLYPGYSYTWNYNTTSLEFAANPQNTRYFTLTIKDDCALTIKDSVLVRVFPLPEIDLNPIMAEGCVPLSVKFSTLSEENDVNSYNWDFGNGNTSIDPKPVFTYTDTGTYKILLKAFNIYGCSNSNKDSSLVIVHPKPVVDFISNPNITDIRKPIVRFTSKSSDGDHFWLFGDTGKSFIRNPEYTFADTGSYFIKLIVIDENGCSDSIEKSVIVGPYFKLAIPTAFTPNTSGSSGGKYDPKSPNNYVFFPITEGVTQFEMLIFSRWGELIFESKNHKIGWDGYYRGELSQQELYVWKLNITWENGQTFEGTGGVTLFR